MKTLLRRQVIVLGRFIKTVLHYHFKGQQLERQIAGDSWIEFEVIINSNFGAPNIRCNVFLGSNTHGFSELIRV